MGVADDGRDRRPRRRARDRARGARPRPVRPALVGAPAADGPGRDRGRPSRLLPGRGDGRDDGQLPGDDRPASRRPGSTGAAALGAIRDERDARPARSRPVRRGGRRLAATDLLVAGSVGPYGAMLADGSEYRGDYDPGDAALARLPRAADRGAARRPASDLLAFETIPTVREAEVLVGLLDEFDAPAWLSYSCRDGSSTSAGEPIEDGDRSGRRIRGSWPSASTAPRPASCRRCLRRRVGHDRPAAHRLPECGRPLGRGVQALARGRRGRRFDPADRRVMDATRGDLAGWLLRDRTGRDRGPGGRLARASSPRPVVARQALRDARTRTRLPKRSAFERGVVAVARSARRRSDRLGRPAREDPDAPPG